MNNVDIQSIAEKLAALLQERMNINHVIATDPDLGTIVMPSDGGDGLPNVSLSTTGVATFNTGAHTPETMLFQQGMAEAIAHQACLIFLPIYFTLSQRVVACLKRHSAGRYVGKLNDGGLFIKCNFLAQARAVHDDLAVVIAGEDNLQVEVDGLTVHLHVRRAQLN